MLRRAVRTLLTGLEQELSTYVSSSDVSRFNSSTRTDWFTVSPATCAVVATALEISALSDGAFDVTVGPLVNAWGFGPEDARFEPPADERISALRDNVGWQQLDADCERQALKKERPGLYIDLSAIAKGYAVDQVAAVLDHSGINDFLVEVGGEVKVRGRNAHDVPWQIGVEKPVPGDRAVQFALPLTRAAVASSGDYRNFFEHDGAMYSHTIDPRTGRPVTHATASVTVVHDSAEYADALATALLVLGREHGARLAAEHDIAAYFQERMGDGKIRTQATVGLAEVEQSGVAPAPEG